MVQGAAPTWSYLVPIVVVAVGGVGYLIKRRLEARDVERARRAAMQLLARQLEPELASNWSALDIAVAARVPAAPATPSTSVFDSLEKELARVLEEEWTPVRDAYDQVRSIVRQGERSILDDHARLADEAALDELERAQRALGLAVELRIDDRMEALAETADRLSLQAQRAGTEVDRELARARDAVNRQNSRLSQNSALVLEFIERRLTDGLTVVETSREAQALYTNLSRDDIEKLDEVIVATAARLRRQN